MQQFIFLPLATYTAQMVFVKTFSHQNTAIRLQKSSEVLEEVKPSSAAATETGKASVWKSLLTDTQSNVKLWPLSNSTFPCTSEQMIALKYENICLTGRIAED